MNYDYNRRSYLLPEGCKDLTDLVQPQTAITEIGFVVTVRLPEIQSRDIAIAVVGSTLRIIARQGDGAPFGKAIEVPVPDDYAPAKAQAMYLQNQLRIVVPKAAA